MGILYFNLSKISASFMIGIAGELSKNKYGFVRESLHNAMSPVQPEIRF
jgi:hypothetical protein